VLKYVFEVEDPKTVIAKGGFVKVRYAGTGFLMIRPQALERMCAQYKQLQYKRDHSIEAMIASENRFALFECMISDDGNLSQRRFRVLQALDRHGRGDLGRSGEQTYPRRPDGLLRGLVFTVCCCNRRRVAPYQVSISTRLPLTPAPLRMPAAEERFCSASAKRLGMAVPLELLVDGPVALPDPRDVLDPLAPAVEGPDVELAEAEVPEVAVELLGGSGGWKALLPVPKPMAAASVPLPTIAMESLSFRLVITNLPCALSDAVTWALVGRSTLMALIRLPIVSLPVDV